jgi:predicted HTH domain antitoxin
MPWFLSKKCGWHSPTGAAIVPPYHMTITLPDDPALLRLNDAQLRLDLACGMFASGRTSRGICARIAGLDRAAFDEALFARHIPSYTPEMLEQDLAVWENMAKE